MESLMDESLKIIIGFVVLVGGAFAEYFRPKINEALKNKKEDSKFLQDERVVSVIKEVSNMGVELIEKEFTGEAGEKKFDEAATYVAQMMNSYGYDVSNNFIKGAVQSAWRRMDSVQKSNKKEENKE